MCCSEKSRPMSYRAWGQFCLVFPCLFDTQGVISRSPHSVPPVAGSSRPIAGSARSQLCWGRARHHFLGEGCAVEVLSPSDVGNPVPFLHPEDESLVTGVVGWRWLGINFSPLTSIPAGSILYSLAARNTVACMAVKSRITFIDLKKGGVCQKLFHFLTIFVGPIKDIIPLNVLHLCHNIYGLTMKDYLFYSIRHERCLSDCSAEMQFSVTQRQSYTAPAWKLI